MKRFFLAATLVLLGATTAWADYRLVKINLNHLDFFTDAVLIPGFGPPPGPGQPPPPAPQPPGGKGPGGKGGFKGGPGFKGPGMSPAGPGMPPDGPPPEDPNPRWIYAFVEFKGPPALLMPAMAHKAPVFIYQFDHRWGTKNWYPIPGNDSPLPRVLEIKSFPDALPNFTNRLSKEKNAKDKNVESILILARLALQHGSMKKFHAAMKEAIDANPKHGVVVQYQRVKKQLEAPFDRDDPTQRDLLNDLVESKYQTKISEQKHYALHHHALPLGDRGTETLIKRRLAMLESTLETFYYWFAVQKENALQPPLPKYRQQVILSNTKEEFLTRHLQWGSEPMVGDGFAPRRHNVIVMSARPFVNDPLCQEFDTLLTTKLEEVNTKVQPFGISVTRDDLLSGKVNDNKFARIGAVPLAYAQVAVLLAKTLEDQNERLTVTNEAVRQLLISAEVFPRNVQIPDWMVEGLAAFFETSPGLYPNVGSKSWTHLVSYKYLRNTKDRRVENPAATLFNVVTDRYFHDARAWSANLRQNPNNSDFRLAARDAWELARCTSWAYVYYLAQTGKLDSLFKYGKELNELPRDMDLSELVVQGCFARAFGMTDNADARRIDPSKLASTASAWSSMMQETNLDNIEVQNFLLEMRAKQETGADFEPSQAADDASSTGPIPGANQPGNLAGSTWSGKFLRGVSAGDDSIKFTFQGGGSVQISGRFSSMDMGKTQVAGKWNQTGKKVTFQVTGWTFADWTLKGNQIISNLTGNGGEPQIFTVTRDGAQPSPGVRPPSPGVRPPSPPRKTGG